MKSWIAVILIKIAIGTKNRLRLKGTNVEINGSTLFYCLGKLTLSVFLSLLDSSLQAYGSVWNTVFYTNS